MNNWTVISKKIFIVIIIFFYVPIAHSSFFYDTEVQNMLIDLRTQINLLQQNIYSKADKSSVLSLITQNDKLHEEIAKLRGEIELLINKSINVQQNEKEFYIILNNRLSKLEEQQTIINNKIFNLDK